MALRCVLPLLALWAAGPNPTQQAEQLASEALGLAASQPEAALVRARKALALTADFEPTLFVTAGRKGEVVEDAYVAARLAYRRHRAGLYEAVGESLARAGRQAAAARYLRRAVDLERSGERVARLARALVAEGHGREALDVLLGEGAAELSGPAIAVAEQAADAVGLPSLQAEIDRVQLEALKVEPRVEARQGPFRIPDRARLSTGEPFRLDGDGLTLVYVAEPACRTCSADLESLKRLVPPGARLVMAPAVPEEDLSLRRVLALYRYAWPVLLGRGAVEALGAPPGTLVAVARHGWSAAVVKAPFERTLAPALEVFARTWLREPSPRAAWNGRPPDRTPRPVRGGLLPDGLAPGEDEPAPDSFARAVEAYRGNRPAEALRLFEALEAEGDGWLLPPEARLDRALCLAALGRREEARRLLLRTGDSRFQDAVDRALETVGTPARR